MSEPITDEEKRLYLIEQRLTSIEAKLTAMQDNSAASLIRTANTNVATTMQVVDLLRVENAAFHDRLTAIEKGLTIQGQSVAQIRETQLLGGR